MKNDDNTVYAIILPIGRTTHILNVSHNKSKMNWKNYLSESKSPSDYPHLGILEGTVRCPFDISELPNNAEIIDMPTPLKKFKLKYTNNDYLIGNKVIEGIIVNDL